METSLANDLHDAALQSEKVTAAKLRQCWNLITELEKHGLDIMMKIFLHLFEIYYLNILYSTIREIASKNGGIIYSLAVEQMFESLGRQYDIKLKLWKLCKGNISY